MKKNLSKTISAMALVCAIAAGSFLAIPVMADEVDNTTIAERPVKPEINENLKFGKVVSVSETEITIEMHGMGGRMGRGGRFLADGTLPEGVERPERPELPEGAERPERPELPEGAERPERPELPEGVERPQGRFHQGNIVDAEVTDIQPEQVVYAVSDSVTVKKIVSVDSFEEISLSDLAEGDMVRLELDDDSNVITIETMPEAPAKPFDKIKNPETNTSTNA